MAISQPLPRNRLVIDLARFGVSQVSQSPSTVESQTLATKDLLDGEWGQRLLDRLSQRVPIGLAYWEALAR